MPGERSHLIKEQARHLLGLLDEHPQFSLQILKLDANIPYLDADMVLLKFDDARRDCAYLPQGFNGRLIKAKYEIYERENYWHKVRAAALERDDARKFLHNVSL